MSPALIATLAVYAVFVPLVVWFLWRQTWPSHRLSVRVPDVLGDDTMVLTTDSDHIGLI